MEPEHPPVRLRRQGALLGLARARLSREPRGASPEHLHRMRVRETPYPATPLYGSRRMPAWRRRQGARVNRKRVARLRRQMGLAAISLKPQLRQPRAGPTRYPSLVQGVKSERVHQVWSAARTSMRVQQGCISVVAVMDWWSRSVVSWAVSITLDGALCLAALESALRRGCHEIVHTDQGAQGTSRACTARLRPGESQSRMDGRGRAVENVLVERLWRSVKDEEVSLQEDNTVREAQPG